MEEMPSVAVHLAEFNALKTELERRASNQSFLLNLNLTGLATLLALHIAEAASLEVLLLSVPFSLLLGGLFLDASLTINRIGDYIRTHTSPVLRTLTSDEDVFRWEDRVLNERRRRGAPLLWRLPTLVSFFAPAGGVSVYVLVASADPRSDWFAVGGIVATLVMGGIWAWLIRAAKDLGEGQTKR